MCSNFFSHTLNPLKKGRQTEVSEFLFGNDSLNDVASSSACHRHNTPEKKCVH